MAKLTTKNTIVQGPEGPSVYVKDNVTGEIHTWPLHTAEENVRNGAGRYAYVDGHPGVSGSTDRSSADNPYPDKDEKK